VFARFSRAHQAWPWASGCTEGLLAPHDLRAGTLIVDGALYRGYLGSPETPKSEREVFVGPVAQRAIEEGRGTKRFTGRDDFMFGIRTNRPKDLHNAIARYVKPACKMVQDRAHTIQIVPGTS